MWRICRTVKTHDSVVDATSMMPSRSILDIASDTWSEYIPYKPMSIFLKKKTIRLVSEAADYSCAVPLTPGIKGGQLHGYQYLTVGRAVVLSASNHAQDAPLGIINSLC
jgi:hypothetical protein